MAVTKVTSDELLWDSGSNANGSWVKYPDGTMICWTIDSPTQTTNTAIGSLFNSGTVDMTFPQPFTATPAIFGAVKYVSGRPWLGLIEHQSSTLVGARVMGYTSSTQGTVSFVAFGRWK